MRSFLALALASSALAVPVVVDEIAKRWTDTLDFQLVNLARNLESLELNYWNQALANFTASDWNDAGYTDFEYYLTLFRNQEIQHFTALNTVLGGNFKNCTYTFPVTTPTEAIMLGQVITTVGEGAFIGAIANLTSSPDRLTGGQILGNEARQNSKLREFLGLDYFNAVNFDTPLSASQAYSLAEPFLNCPSSNPPIEFTLIPSLMANFTDTSTKMHQAGEEIAVMWDASMVTLGDDVHIQFLADVYMMPAALNQTGTGMGTTVLPPNINGTAILVATNFDGPGPIPDAQNFAIGYVVVA